MNDDIYSDLTDEEKGLLKRDVKRRIEMQRKREQAFTPLTGKIVVMGGIAAILFTIAMPGPIVGAGASPLAPLLLLSGGLCVAIGLVMWFVLSKR